jgi:uridine phosphorylase
MKPIANSELILNDDGSIYHLHLHPEQLADTLFVVGDQGRVEEVSRHFDRLEHQVANREFITHTGYIGHQRFSVMSTGIGVDNIDIVMNEVDALCNIELKKRTVRKEQKSINIIRLGTSGALQKDVPIDSFLASSHGMGLDNLMHFYAEEAQNIDLKQAFVQHSQWPSELSSPYFCEGSDKLLKHFQDLQIGITATAPGFYAPQGRSLRLNPSISDLHPILNSFEHQGLRITNFEMETSALYGLGKLLNHNCLTICAIIANRITQEYSKDYKKTVENMITFVLNRLSNE